MRQRKGPAPAKQSDKQTCVTFPNVESLEFVRETAALLGISLTSLASEAIIREATKRRREVEREHKCPMCKQTVRGVAKVVKGQAA